LRRSLQALKNLERALNNIDDPDFGLCENCDEEIPFARLMIMPETVLCVLCASNIA